MPNTDEYLNISVILPGMEPGDFKLIEDAIWRPGYAQDSFLLESNNAKRIAETWVAIDPARRAMRSGVEGIIFAEYNVGEMALWPVLDSGFYVTRSIPGGALCKGFMREMDDRTALETMLGWVNDEPTHGPVTTERLAELLGLTGRPVVG